MNLIDMQQKFFRTGATRSVDYRIRQLRSLYQVILQYQERIMQALREDLSKSEQESYLTEIGMVLSEISYALRHLRRWSRPKGGGFSLAAPFSVNRVYPEPYGVALVIAPFNYPFQLALSPVVSALAAGNCAILKPSEYAPNTAAVISEMLNNNFEQRLLAVVTGGPEGGQSLLGQDFDYIFFTGGKTVGQKVYEAAARGMVPVTLELGGKSPCLVDASADIEEAARRIVWGKCLNAGQTCVAPDYLLVQDSVKQKLIAEMCRAIEKFYSAAPEQNPDYPRIINQAHYERLCEMLGEGTVVAGGRTNEQELKISPTIIENAPFYSKLMNDEIFGPLLPVIEFSQLEQAYEYISLHERPLALYLFTRRPQVEREVLQKIQFGGGCVNDTVIHLCPHDMPFGGIGPSGIGSYHGKAGFDTFTHYKSVLKTRGRLDLQLRYPPFGKVSPLVQRLLR